MPDPANYDDEKEFMSVCVPKLMGEGKDNDQAVAICLNMWKEKKSWLMRPRGRP